MEPGRRHFINASLSLTRLFLALIFVVIGYLVLKNRYQDLSLAYTYVSGRMWQDIDAPQGSEANDLKNLAFRSVQDLKHMLMSTDQDTRIAAIKALGEKGDVGICPHLLALIIDRGPIEPSQDPKESHVCQAARDSLEKILRKNTTRDPSDLSVLLPYLTGLMEGTPGQRSAMAEIFGSAREPLALPFLGKLAADDPDERVRKSALKAVQAISTPRLSASYEQHRTRLRELLLAIAIAVLILMICLLIQILRGPRGGLMGLRLMGVITLAGFAVILFTELFLGKADDSALNKAFARGDLLAIRTANYHDAEPYPGDSVVAQRMAALGDGTSIALMRKVPSVEPDDLLFFREMIIRRSDWAASRILMAKGSDPEWETMLTNMDLDTRKYLASLPARMKVKTKEFAQLLDKLSADLDDEVRKIAQESRKKLAGYAEWPAL